MQILLKKWYGWLPIAMSLAAFFILISYILIYGVSRNEDEGLAAHTFQLLIVGQAPVVFYFLYKNYSKSPKRSFGVLLIQIIAALIPVATLYILEM